MKANEVKYALSEQDIFSLLSDFGADPREVGGNIVSRTCCHNPAHAGKHKLIYYPDSQTFVCFTGCGSMDVFGLIGKILNLEFFDSFKYVCMKFGISYKNDFESNRVDVSFFPKFKENREEVQLNILDKNILNYYYDLYHQSWLDDGINMRTMKKFGIKYSIMDNQIIIPHHDILDNLIGVRARNLNEEVVAAGKKYMPVYYKKNVLKHPTGASLYGLNKTKDMVEKYKAIILFESEKSVMQLDSFMPEMSIGACISGSSLTDIQINILDQLDVEEVIIAVDKEFEEVGSKEDLFYRKKIHSSFLNRLGTRFKTSVIWDMKGLLDLKDSPTDKGPEVFSRLFEERLVV